MNTATTILTFIIVFGLLVLVHEFGHYYFAKKAGILVREFSIGMGPKIFSRQKNGTAYTIRWLPLGGYVRMAGWGEDDNEIQPGTPVGLVLNEKQEVTKINLSSKIQFQNALPMEVTYADLEKQLHITGYVYGNGDNVTTYPITHDASIIEEDGTEIRIAPLDVQMQSAKIWQRILVNFAGPLNNFILSLVLFILLVFMQGGVFVTNTNALGEVLPNSAAEKAGLKEGDNILTINGQKIQSWEEMTPIVASSPDKPLEVTYSRQGKEEKTILTPLKEGSGKDTVGKMGVYAPFQTSIFAKLKGGFSLFKENSLAIFKGIGSLIARPNLDKLGGPVMMFKYSSEAAKSGIKTVIGFMAMLSVNLGLMNLLPIPALDGGKIVLNVIEALRGKPLSQEKEGILTLVGFVFLFGLMILVTWNDISRYFLR